MSKLSGTPPPSTDASPVAHFQDLQHDIMIPIHKETHFYIGLTTAAELRLVDESHSNAPNDVVATLFKVVRKGRTHWLHSVTSFPCQIDDIDVNDAAPLYQGALIRVADRMFRYQSAWPVYAPDQTLTADDLPDYMNSLEVDMDMPSLSSDWCVVKIPSLADELQESLDSPEQIAHLAASYISQQMVLHTDTSFTSVELDDVFKSIAHVAILDAPMLMKFILAYNKGQCDYRDRKPGDFESSHYSRWIDDNNIDRTLPCSLHAPVIELLKDSLRISLEPIELATLWLKLLEAFSHFTSNLDVMIRHSVTPVVLGAMAVYGDDAAVQALVLSILTKMATYTPLPGVKSPVRESAVELIVMSLKNHPYDVTVVEPAFSTLLTLSQTYSKLIANLLNCGPMLTAVHDCVRRASGLLDYIDHTALPIVKEVSGRHTDNPQIQDYCAKLTTCLHNRLANTMKTPNSTATINASLGLPSDYAVPDQLYAENEERKRKISAHFQPNFTRDYHEKSDEYTINHALSKSPTVENGVYETIARVPHSSPPRAQDEGIYETIKTIDMIPQSSQTTIQDRPRKLWNTSRQPQNMYTEYEPHQFSSITSSEQSANGDINPLRCKSTASDMGRHSLYTDPSKGSAGVHSPINVVIVDPLTAAHSSSQNTGSPAFRRPDGYLDDLKSQGVPASRQVGFSRYVGKQYVSDYGYFDGADSLCHYRNYDSSSDEYYSDIEKYGDGEMQAGYYMVNQDDISADSEAPELPPRLYNEPERTSVQHQHSEDTQVESLSWTPLENNHNDSTTSDSNTEPEMSSPQTGHVTPDPPSHIDPVSYMSSPTNPDMVISGQVNFISDGSSMDNEDFDDFICDIYEGHPEVMDDLKRKYEIINDMSNRWKRDPFAAIQVLSDNASELDMSVTVTLLQTCMKSTTSTEIMMRGIQVASNLLDHPMHPLIADTLCTCIAQVLEGALKEEIDGGWGFFTLRKLHLLTGNILSNEDLPITSGLDELYRLLDELVTVKN